MPRNKSAKLSSCITSTYSLSDSRTSSLNIRIVGSCGEMAGQLWDPCHLSDAYWQAPGAHIVISNSCVLSSHTGNDFFLFKCLHLLCQTMT